MITSLRIAHFKAAADVTVPLGPITVLIGPNDSGKSTILQALMTLSRATDPNHLVVEQLLTCPLSVAPTNHDLSKEIGIAAHGTVALDLAEPAPHNYRYGITASGALKCITNETIVWDDTYLAAVSNRQRTFRTRKLEGTWPGGSSLLSALLSDPVELGTDHRNVRAIATDLRATLLRLDSRAIAAPARLGAPLLDDGSGLVGIVDELLTSGVGDDKIARANEVIRTLSPHVRGVAAKLHQGGGKELHFALRSGTVIPASQMSDGVVLAAALVLIALGAGSKRLLIEEPENGLHPRQLRVVADTLRSLATEHGTQIVLTTHSPLLLNHFSAEETLLVTRSEAGVQVRPMSQSPALDELASEMSLGELWYNVGDSDLARPA